VDVLRDKPSKVFVNYAVPSVFGMLAVSSATVVDGFFVGNYIGASGLAAINLSMPIFSLLFGLALMLSIGSSVVSGKLMGEGDTEAASIVFSKSMVVMLLMGISFAGLLYINIDNLISFLSIPANLTEMVSTYLTWMLFFLPFLMSGLLLDYFVKIDSRPLLAFGALLLTAFVNIVLDWAFIVYFEMGIFGAAFATGLSQLSLLFVLLPHFFSKKATIKFVNPFGSYAIILKAAFNGSSEFVNEVSIGITTLIFNYIMMQSFGVVGVAAYTVVSYVLWVAIMVSFGISDSLQAPLSKNFGAKEVQRIEQFLKYAFSSVIIFGLLLVGVVLGFPELIIDVFLESGEKETSAIILAFLALVWPAFLFSGSNMVISAYFTALHKPISSGVIAISRSLVFPILFIVTLPLIFGDKGLYLAIAAAEFMTLIIAIILFIKNSPKNLMKKGSSS